MTKSPLRFYLEASFWRRLADPVSSARRASSFRLLRFLEARHSIVISRLVIEEVLQTTTPDERRPILRRLDRARPSYQPVTQTVRRATAAILAAAGWGPGMVTDAVHLASAMIALADVFVTWDIADLARPKTRAVMEKVELGRRAGHMQILTPEEALAWLHGRTR